MSKARNRPHKPNKPSKPRKRRQRVIVRQRRREQIVTQARGMFKRTAFLAIAGGLIFLSITKGDVIAAYFMREHTPKIEFKAPQMIPIPAQAPALPKQLCWLWLPGSGKETQRQLLASSKAIRAVRFEKDFLRNTIMIRLIPRIALARIGESQGLDEEGIQFPLPSDTWKTLPRATLTGSVTPLLWGKWLAQISKEKTVWPEVVAIADDKMGNLILEMQNGGKVLWGAPEARGVGEKTGALARVLDDAHQNLGGASATDLRFFDEGRIIVKPKAAKG